MALTDTKVRSAKPEAKEYSLVDGDGMFLLIHPNGSKYWRFRFGGKQHPMVFGVYPETSLADARQKREEARRLVAAGIDPREHKRAVKEEQAKESSYLNLLPETGTPAIKSGLSHIVVVFLKVSKIICSMRLVSGISLSLKPEIY